MSSVEVQLNAADCEEGIVVGFEKEATGGGRNFRGISGAGLSSMCHLRMRRKATIANASLECIIVSVSSLLGMLRMSGMEDKSSVARRKGNNYIIIRFLNKGQSKTKDSYSPPSPDMLSSHCLLFEQIINYNDKQRLKICPYHSY